MYTSYDNRNCSVLNTASFLTVIICSSTEVASKALSAVNILTPHYLGCKLTTKCYTERKEAGKWWLWDVKEKDTGPPAVHSEKWAEIANDCFYHIPSFIPVGQIIGLVWLIGLSYNSINEHQGPTMGHIRLIFICETQVIESCDMLELEHILLSKDISVWSFEAGSVWLNIARQDIYNNTKPYSRNAGNFFQNELYSKHVRMLHVI